MCARNIMHEGQIESQRRRRDKNSLFADSDISAQFDSCFTRSKQGNAGVVQIATAGPLETQLGYRAQYEIDLAVCTVADQIDIDIGAPNLKVEAVDLSLNDAARMKTIITAAFIFGRDTASQAQCQAVAFRRWRPLEGLAQSNG